jgi:hypothetical protein
MSGIEAHFSSPLCRPYRAIAVGGSLPRLKPWAKFPRPFGPTRPHVHTSTRPLVHSSTRPLVHTSTRPHVHTSTRPLVHTSTRPHVHTSTRPHVHSLTRPHAGNVENAKSPFLPSLPGLTCFFGRPRLKPGLCFLGSSSSVPPPLSYGAA